jgi:hypothetical protein
MKGFDRIVRGLKQKKRIVSNVVIPACTVTLISGMFFGAVSENVPDWSRGFFSQAGWAFSSWLTSRYIHGDFHPFWVNPENPDHYLAGTDGGLYSSYDKGETWHHHPLPIGQFYTVTADMRHPYYIWGGNQDNGGWAGPSLVRHITGISNYDWFKFEESDGGYVQVDPDDPMIVYSEWQYGCIRRLDMRRGTWTPIQPENKGGEEPLRFHFIAPFLLSNHDTSVLYMGAQKIMKTTDRKKSWRAVSPDLTYGDSNAAISAVSESSAEAGVLYAGTEDGRLHVTLDDGRNWREITGNIPGFDQGENEKRLYVSRVEASHTYPGAPMSVLTGITGMIFTKRMRR